MNEHRILSGLGRAQSEDASRRSSVGNSNRRRSIGRGQRSVSQREASKKGSAMVEGASSDGFEFDPLDRPRRERVVLSNYSQSGSSTANESDHGINQIHLVGDQDEDDVRRRANLRDVGQLASVFLELRKGIMSNKNIDTAHNEMIEFEKEPIRGPHIRSVSKNTLQRAEKVKAMINLYYYSVFQTQKPLAPKYVGVDGIYNPLQIIRNRKVRKKHRELPQLVTKTMKLPSQAFSSHKHKMVWQVDLDELTHDAVWRGHRWNELINPHGELWFPIEDPQRNHHSDLNSTDDEQEEESLTNMHDRLFQDDHDNSRDTSASSREDLLEVPSRRHKIASKIKKRSKSPFKKVQNLTSDQIDKDKSKLDNPGEESTTDVSILETPAVSKTNILTDISIEPIKHQKPPLTADSTLAPPITAGGTSSELRVGMESPEESTDLGYEDWRLTNLYLQKLRHLNNLSEYSGHTTMVQKEECKNLIDYDKLWEESDETEMLIKALRDGGLLQYEAVLKDSMEKVNKIHDNLTNDISTRVDKLLLLSDRTIGEVNTSLSLEVRKFSEKIGKLGPIHRRTGSLVSFTYWLLENLVVLLLWTIWVGFSIGRVVKFALLVLWRVLEWIIG